MKYFIVVFLLCFSAKASSEEEGEALKYASMAAFKQFGIEDNINEYLRKKVPKQYQEMAAKIAPILDIVVRQRVEVKWKF